MRVEYTEIEFDDNLIYYYRDMPFTGTTFRLHSNGILSWEQSFVNGMETGFIRRWYPNGQMKSESPPMNIKNSIYREWYPNGRLQEIGRCIYGRTIERKHWDEVGNLTEHWLAPGITPEIHD